MPYFPPPPTGFVPLNGSLPMTGALTTPAVIASTSGTAANPAFAVNTNYGIFFDSTNTALGIATAGVENNWFLVSGSVTQRAGGALTQSSVTGEGAVNIFATRYSTDAIASQITGRKARGTIAAPLVVATNDIVMTQAGMGWDGVSAFQIANQLRTFVIEPTPGPTAMGGSFRITVSALGSIAQTEVARFEPATGLSMFGANPVVDINRTLIPGSGTTAALPAATLGGLRYVTDLEGGSGIVYGGIGPSYRNIMDGQVATATPSGVGVLTEFTGFCDYTYRNIVLSTHAQLTRAGLLTGKLLGFYVFAVPTNQNDALINWATPGTRNATITGTPVFTANQGFTGDGTTALINGVATWANFGAAQSNVCIGCYVLAANTAGAAERAIIGQNNAAQGRRTYLTSFTSGTLHTTLSVQTATGDLYTPPRYTGLFVLNRSAANGATSYTDSVDDIAPTSIGTASAVVGSAVCWLGTNDISGTSFSNAQLACGFIGANITNADIVNLRTIIRDYYLVQIGAVSANYTVALLPLVTSVPTGTRYNVTDATVTTFASIVAGGGTNFVPVTNNGTNWIIG